MVYIVVSDPSDPSLLNKQRAAAIESLINMATGNTGMYTRLMPSTPNEVVKNPVVVSIVQPDRVEVVTYYLDENGEIKVVYRAEEYSRWKDSVYMPATSFKWPEGPNLDMADEKDLPILTRAKELAEQFGYFAQSCLRSGGYSPA